MAEFQLTRTGNERLWVGTPFPVCQNVWSSFVFKIFPEFVVHPESMSLHKHNGRYINRKKEYDEIADGQALGYIHAYLPHCDRSQGRVNDWGLVHVPDSRVFYLDQIAADLSENPRSRSALLDSLKQVHAETVSYLLNQLMDVGKRAEFRNVKSTKELRDVFSKEITNRGLFNGCFNDPGNQYIGCWDAGKIPVGELPLYMRGQKLDFLRSQTCLDFLRDIDRVIGVDRELNPVDLLEIPLAMNQRYSEIARV